MISFSQAYHYIVDCPARKLTRDPLPKSQFAGWFSRFTLDLFIDVFMNRDFVDGMAAFSTRLDEIRENEPVTDLQAKVKLYQKGVMNTTVFAAEREDTPADYIGKFEADPMLGELHLARVKPNRMVELSWFNFETVRPDMHIQDILSVFAQWHGRAYEVKYERRPYQLTIYYPIIGISIPFIYNTENRLDVVAELIDMGVYYTKPDRERCMTCRACPEYVRMDQNGCINTMGNYLC